MRDMKITVISGSHRENSQSERIARYIASDLSKQGAEASVLSLAKNPLPLWDEGVWGGEPKWEAVWGPISETLKKSDGFVVVSPEWSGMVPAGLKNFFLLCGSREVGHKPAMIVSVSSGIGGSYPVAELRQSSYKNTRIVYIPDHVIVRNAEAMLVGESPADDHDAELRKRVHYSLGLLLEYAKALTLVRESGKVNLKDFPYGM
jgi:NAD(P)H-dependent FMN reductase